MNIQALQKKPGPRHGAAAPDQPARNLADLASADPGVVLSYSCA